MDRFHQMTVFRRVVEAGSITRAANSLNMSQPSVSRVVADLEDRLGTPLFLRASRGLQTTDAGRQYYGDAVRVLDDLEESESTIHGAAAEAQGRLRVAASNAFYLRVIAAWMPDFLEANPRVVFEALLDEHRTDLLAEAVDVAIRVGSLSEQSLVARRLGEVKFALYASPSYLEKAGVPEKPEDLGHHLCALSTLGTGVGHWMLHGPNGQEEQVDVTGRFYSSSLEAVRVAVEQGMGIGLLSIWSSAEQVDAGFLVPVLPEWRGSPLAIHAVWPAARNLPRRTRAFIDYMVECFAKDARVRIG